VPAVRADLRRDEAIITTLAQLFIKRPSEWTVRCWLPLIASDFGSSSRGLASGRCVDDWWY
jgi:hypothetical protein